MAEGWHEEQIKLNRPDEAIPVPIIGDGAIKTIGVAGGRLVPALILNTSSRDDIENLILEHMVSPGECSSSWAKADKQNEELRLILEFTRPVPLVIILNFVLKKHAGIVDQIIRSGHLYLFTGQGGERVADLVSSNSPKLLVEVPSDNFKPEWEQIYDNHLKGQGLNHKQIKKFKREWRKLS